MQARMRQMSLVAVVTLGLVVVLGGTALAQSDPFVGTWKANMAKSKYDPASLTPKTGNTQKIEVAGSNGYKQTTDGVNAQGVATHSVYTATLDGKDYPVTGNTDWDSVSLKKIDANTHMTVNKKGGTVVRMARNVVSKDGKTRTAESVGYNAQGVATHNVVVYDKQ